MEDNLRIDPAISFYLDRSRKTKSGKYKVRLYINSKRLNQKKYYSTIFEYSTNEFAEIWETNKPKSKWRKAHDELSALLAVAKEKANELGEFTFEDYERIMFGKDIKGKDVNFFYSKTIHRYYDKGSISTAKNYETSLKCLLRYHKKPNIQFKQVSINWLEGFEKFCLEEENKSPSTVGIYLRTLRTVFNDAIADKTISQDIYPFGRRKYVIPSSRNTKKALTPENLKVLFEGSPKTMQQKKAKAFWFFEYLTNGINIKDILNLRCKDIDQEKITFIRAKTQKTRKEQAPIIVYLNEYIIDVINTYGNRDQKPKDYVFPILSASQDAETQYKKVKNFVSMVNQNFTKYAKGLGIEENVSNQSARHSFATMAVRKGANMAMVGEALGHTDTKTTQAYFAGFEDKTKKELSHLLLDF